MKSTAKPSSVCSSRICCRISRCTTTSSAVVGSSMITSSGPERERHRDHHALPHAAGELVRVRAEPPAVDADELEQVARARERLVLRHALVRAHHVDELVAHAHDRVERVHRALEDHRDVAPAEPAQLFAAAPDDVLAVEQHAAARDLRGRAQDLHHRVAERALAAAGLAGEADDLAGADRRARRRRPPASCACASRSRRRGSRARRRASRARPATSGVTENANVMPPAGPEARGRAAGGGGRAPRREAAGSRPRRCRPGSASGRAR